MRATRWAPAERAEGQVLFCNARPRSDLVIAPRSIGKADPFARKTIDARVFRLRAWPTTSCWCTCAFPPGSACGSRPGSTSTSFSTTASGAISRWPIRRARATASQLHIRHVPGGAFTSYVFEKLKRGDRLRVEIPFGDFTLRESDKPILFVAGSTGFAPINSIIEDMFIQGHRARHDAVLGRAPRGRALLRSAGALGSATSALQIRAGAVRRRGAGHPPRPGASGRARGPSQRSPASRPMSAACRL